MPSRLLVKLFTVEWTKVVSHTGVLYNERADRLAHCQAPLKEALWANWVALSRCERVCA